MNELQQDVKGKLEAIVAGDLSGIVYAQCGLCSNLSPLSRVLQVTLREWLKEHSKTWEHYSGVACYPIASDTLESNPGAYYECSHDLWKGRQLEQRQLLAQHLLNNLHTLEA